MSSADDRLDILDLLGRYSFGADGDVPTDYTAVFCEDGEFVGRTGQPDEIRVTGRDALLKFVESVVSRRHTSGVKTRHHQSSTVFVEVTPDTAVTRTYLLTTSVASQGAPNLGLTSIYEDHLVRTPGGWRIKQRRALPDVHGTLDQRRSERSSDRTE